MGWITNFCILFQNLNHFFALLTTLKSTSQVYLSRILVSAHSVFRALAILTSPVEMELLEPVGARDGSICQSCKNTSLIKHWTWLTLHQHLILHQRCKGDGREMIEAQWLEEEWPLWQKDTVTVTETALVPVVQDQLRWKILINVQVLLTSTLHCYIMHLFAVCQVFETVADNPTYFSIATHIAFPKQRFSPSLSVHSLD